MARSSTELRATFTSRLRRLMPVAAHQGNANAAGRVMPQFQWKSEVRFPLKLRELSTGSGVSWPDTPEEPSFN
ncbi:hypothetical protein ACWEV3_10070 [Saccharopolyspora sp. NPDC003752]